MTKFQLKYNRLKKATDNLLATLDSDDSDMEDKDRVMPTHLKAAKHVKAILLEDDSAKHKGARHGAHRN